MNIHKMQAFLSKKSKSLKNMENSNITFILHFIKSIDKKIIIV